MKLPTFSSLCLTNTDGKPSASLTLAVIAFCLTSVWFILGGIFKGVPHITPFNSGDALAFLTPCLTLYFGRRTLPATDQPV